jgi:hypothetical protein
MHHQISSFDFIKSKKECHTKKEKLLRALFIAEHHNKKVAQESYSDELGGADNESGFIEEVSFIIWKHCLYLLPRILFK